MTTIAGPIPSDWQDPMLTPRNQDTSGIANLLSPIRDHLAGRHEPQLEAFMQTLQNQISRYPQSFAPSLWDRHYQYANNPLSYPQKISDHQQLGGLTGQEQDINYQAMLDNTQKGNQLMSKFQQTLYGGISGL